MEAKPSVPRAILVGIQVPSVDDVAHAASIEELGHLGACPSIKQILLAKDERVRFQLAA
jgi:hypothetical protein